MSKENPAARGNITFMMIASKACNN